jgi:transcriptional regulator with XRE-family HTH domain
MEHEVDCLMLIGQRLRDIREAKNLSQGHIERATGLMRPYISRVENGHTVPSIETLQKWAAALGMQLYQVLYEGEEPPEPPKLPSKVDEKFWGHSGREARELDRLRWLLAKMDESDRNTLLTFAARIARRSRMK